MCLEQYVKDSLEKLDTEAHSELLRISNVECFAKMNIIVNYFCQTFLDVS